MIEKLKEHMKSGKWWRLVDYNPSRPFPETANTELASYRGYFKRNKEDDADLFINLIETEWSELEKIAIELKANKFYQHYEVINAT